MNYSIQQLNPAENTANARNTHRNLLQSTEMQLHMAFDRACKVNEADRATLLTINLLPALRARYGNLLNERLLHAEYVFNAPENSNGVERLETEFLDEAQKEFLTRISAKANFYYVIAGVNGDRPIEWATQSEGMYAPSERHPNSLMQFVENLAYPDVVAETRLFSDHALGLLLSQEAIKNERGDFERELRSEKGRATFYQSALKAVVDADKTPTLDTIYKTLKSTYQLQSAHGIGSEEATTYWLELGEIVHEGSNHILGDLAQSQIEGDVRAAIKALPEAAQLVLWQAHGGMNNYFDDDYSNADGAVLFDDSNCFDEIVSKVCSWLTGSAIDDWHNRAEKP